jgi:hypothetical protein
MEGLKTGQLTVMIPDDLERDLRVRVAELRGGARGALGDAISEGIRLWLRQETPAKKK